MLLFNLLFPSAWIQIIRYNWKHATDEKKMAWSILKTLRQFNFFMCVYTESVFFLSFNLLTLKMQYLYYTMTNIPRTWSKDYICWRETKISFIILWSFLETCGHTRTGYYFYWSDEHCFCTRLPVVHNTFAVFFKMLAYHISNGFLHHWFQIMWV